MSVPVGSIWTRREPLQDEGDVLAVVGVSDVEDDAGRVISLLAVQPAEGFGPTVAMAEITLATEYTLTRAAPEPEDEWATDPAEL